MSTTNRKSHFSSLSLVQLQCFLKISTALFAYFKIQPLFVNLVYQISAKSLLQCLPKGSIDPVLDEEDEQVEGGDRHLANQGHNARALTKTKVDTQTFWKSGNIIIKLGLFPPVEQVPPPPPLFSSLHPAPL